MHTHTHAQQKTQAVKAHCAQHQVALCMQKICNENSRERKIKDNITQN